MTDTSKTTTYDATALRNPDLCQGSPTHILRRNHEGHPVKFGNITCPLCGWQPYVNDMSLCEAFIAAPHPARHPASELASKPPTREPAGWIIAARNEEGHGLDLLLPLGGRTFMRTSGPEPSRILNAVYSNPNNARSDAHRLTLPPEDVAVFALVPVPRS